MISIPGYITLSLFDLSFQPKNQEDKIKLNHIMQRPIFVPSIITITTLVVILLLPDTLLADPRNQIVSFTCRTELEHNATIRRLNFIDSMENISNQIRTTPGFGLAVTGSGPDADYSIAQCYGDLSKVDCVLCYAEGRTLLPECHTRSGGRVYLDGCFMRVENYSFFEEYTGPNDHAVCGNMTRNDTTFRESVRRALSQAVSLAPESNGHARARVSVSGPGNVAVYVLANCWRTLSVSSCRACLTNASASMLGCLPASEGRALNTGCYMRYSDIDFLNPIPRNGNRLFIVRAIKAASSATFILIMGVLIGVYIRRQRIIQHKRKVGSGDARKSVRTLHDSSLNFKYSTLEKATASFDEANKIGQGGFGTVYKGVLPDGREIAVKRLFSNNRHRAADFYNEVNIISKIEHKNLVRLLGCSCSGQESILVYEFLPNMSLDRFIFDTNEGKALNWEKRFEIILGTARGLVYLHENTKSRIVHRDIKASNILLDSTLGAKIADFGLARSFQEDKSHISTTIAGTLGYMAPEYIARGQLTEKVDVYSFGVVLLEIVTGMPANRSTTLEYTDSLLTTAWKHFQQKTFEELFDPNLMLSNYQDTDVKNEILRVVQVGLLCTQNNQSLRPSMSKVLEMLVKKEDLLPEPTSPPFMDENTMELIDTKNNMLRTLSDGNVASVANISESIFYPR